MIMKSPQFIIGAGALVTLLVASTIAALLTGVPHYLDLARNIAQADGVVVRTTNGVLFAYSADGIRYTGHYQTLGEPAPSSGQRVTVYYHAERPILSSNYHPIRLLTIWRAQAVLIAGSFALMLFLAFALPWADSITYLNRSADSETDPSSQAADIEPFPSLPYSIAYQNQGIWWHTGFLGLWLAGWTGLCVLLIRAAIMSFSIEHVLLLLPFILAELFGITLVAWLTLGRRELTLTEDLLTIRYELLGRQLVRQIPRSAVRHVWHHDGNGPQFYCGVEIATVRGITTLGWLQPEQSARLASVIAAWARMPIEVVATTSAHRHWNAV